MPVLSELSRQVSAPAGAAPLVTIGIPAYNRPWELERAVSSALAQDHPALEILVSDDASPDPAVAAMGRRLAGEDSRVRFARQPVNLGHAGNYQWVLDQARSDYFMWLSDDDWIDPGYVSRCLAILLEDATTVLACGLARYYREGAFVVDERPIELDSPRAGVRLVRYFGRVSMNGPLFGVARRGDLAAVGFPPVVGGDWLLVAELAARGRVRTLRDVRIHRSITGLGADPSALARSFGLDGARATHHHLLVAVSVARRILAGDGGFGALRPALRPLVAAVVAAEIVLRFTVGGLARRLLGGRLAGTLERRVSSWLRARDAR